MIYPRSLLADTVHLDLNVTTAFHMDPIIQEAADFTHGFSDDVLQLIQLTECNFWLPVSFSQLS